MTPRQSYYPATTRLSSQSISSTRSSTSSTLGSSSMDSLSIVTQGLSSTCSSDPMYIGIHLDNRDTAIHPNRIIRGAVKIRTSKLIYASRIRIQFRCVECAIVKVKDIDSFPKFNRIEKITTTYFEAETNVWGTEPSAYTINGWKTIEPGEHEFKFALKSPNVNFPPSTETPIGFSIRYIWTAFVDGPVNHPSICSADLTTTYRPLMCCPSPTTPWTFREDLYSSKKASVASIAVTLPAQVFFPEQQFSLNLAITSIAPDMVVTSISYKLRQYYEGRVLLPHGTARRHFHRDIMHHTLPMPDVNTNSNQLLLPDVGVSIPSTWVSPCFSSKYTRMYYALVFAVHVLTPGFFGTVEHVQATIPIGMANVDSSQWGRVHTIQDYRQSLDAPFFFDPSLNEPASEEEEAASLLAIDANGIDNVMAATGDADYEGDDTLPPPSYASLQLNHQQRQQLQAQDGKRERVEKTRCLTRWVKPDMMPELGEALIVVPALHDDY